MRFTCDEPKRLANLDKHGFDLAVFEEAFDFARFATLVTKPSRNGRARLKLIGTWNGETVVVVIIAPLGSEAIDVVSVRRANRRERAVYDAL